MAGIRLGVGIDLSEFQKDISYINKELKSVAAQQSVINLKLDIPKGNIKREFELAQKQLRDAISAAGNIQIKGAPIRLDSIKDAERAVKTLQTELRKAERFGDTAAANTAKSSIAKLHNYIQSVGQMSNAMANVGLTTSSKPSALAKSERAEIDKQIKALEKKRSLILANSKIPLSERIKEERTVIQQIIKLLERKNATYAAGSSKAVNMRINSLKQELSVMKEQGGMFQRLKTFAGAYLNVFTVFQFVKKLVDVTKELERQGVALEGIIGSASKATEVMNELQNMALNSPFNVKDLIGWTKQLSAYGLEVEELLPTTHKLAELSAGLGVDMGRLILAYGQVNAASVLRGQELRQFTEAGVPLVEKLADKFTELNGRLVTTGEVFELISKRQVSFQMVSDVLTEMTSEGGKFYKMQENLIPTLYGQIEKMKDMWTIALKKFGSGTSGIIHSVVGLLQSFAKNLSSIMAGASVVGILIAIRSLYSYFRNGLIYIKKWHASLKEAAATTHRMRFAMASVMRVLKSNVFFAVLGVATSLIARAVEKSREWKKQLDEINNSFAKDTATYVHGLNQLVGKLASTAEGTKEYNQALETLLSNYGEFVDDSVIKQLIEERQAVMENAKAWEKVYENIAASIEMKKEWERLNANKDAVGEGLAGIVDYSQITKGLNNAISASANAMSASATRESKMKNVEQYNKLVDIRTTLSQKDAENAIKLAINAFTTAGEKTLDEFTKRLKLALQVKGIEGEAKKYLLDEAGSIFEQMTSSEQWGTYENTTKQLEDNVYASIKKGFEEAQDVIKGSTEHKWQDDWVEGEDDWRYNPFKNEAFEDITYSNTAKGLVNANLSNIDLTRDVESVDKYNEAVSKVNDAFRDLSLESFLNNAGKTKEIAEAMRLLIDSITDPTYKSILDEILKDYTELAGTRSGVSAEIASQIQKEYGEGSTASKEEKEFMMDWMPTDQDYERRNKELVAELKRVQEIIEMHGGSSQNPQIQLIIDQAKQDEGWIKKLMGEKFYDIEQKPKKTGGGARAEQLPTELTDFLDKLKNAYETYRDASQKGGYNMALGYVRNDEQFTEMFGEFFHGADSELFKGLKDIVVNKKTKETAYDILKDSFISGGLEDGFIDFEAAIYKVADALEDYSKTSKGTTHSLRKAFANTAKQLRQYAHKTFANDNLKIKLEEFERALKSITNNFEQTNKAIEAYKKTIKQGTAGKFGSMISEGEEKSLTPQSILQEKLIQDLIATYNEKSKELNGETIDISGKTTTPADIYNLINEIEKVVSFNNKNFGADVMGKPGLTIVQELKKLADVITNEITQISGKAIGGSGFSNAVRNAVINSKSADYNLKEAQLSASLYNAIDSATIEALLKTNKEDAQSFFDEFMKSSKSEMMQQLFSGGIDVKKFEKDYDKAVEQLKAEFEKEETTIPATLEFELNERKEDLIDKISKFNEEGSKIGFGDEFTKYRNADKKYKDKFDETTQSRDALLDINETYNKRRAELKEKIDNNTATENEQKEYHNINILIAQNIALLQQYNDKLTEIGENGALGANQEKMEALASMRGKLEKFSENFGKMQDAITSVVDSIKATTEMFSKFYDIANDGENPKWLNTMQQGMEDFTENLKTAVAPILAVVGAIVAVIVVVEILTSACAALGIAATPLLVVMAALIGIAAVVAAVMSAIQAHDNNLQASIEDIEKEIEAFDRAAERLNSTAERMVGFDKMKAQVDALGKSMSKATAAAEQARLEEEKKNTDEDKLQEYNDAAFEYEEEFKNGLKDMLDELVGAVEDWSSAISDAIRSAFQNGENAARAFQSTVKEMIGDVVQKMLDMAILEPIIKGAIQDWTDQEDLADKYTHEYERIDDQGNRITESEFDEEGYLEELLANIKDPKKVKKFYAQMLNAGDALIDAIESLPPELKDAYAFNSEISALSGGISGITEDTARQLEAIGNSQLIQLIQIKQLLETYAGGGLDKTHMAYVQTHLTLINNNVANIVKAINELRTTTVNPLHVTVV